ncbi:MAG TPA: hypothetical protein VEC35_07770, partial [Noviherbaspirillum sp.]|nr:hypothetical protein [Noviherbaspirillum sp.]
MAAPWERYNQPANLQVPQGPWTQFAAPQAQPTREQMMRLQAEERLARERAENPGLDALSAPGAAETAIRGIPILGGFVDEAKAGISAGANALTGGYIGQPYDEALEYERARHRRSDAEHPVANTVTKLAGGVAMAPLTPVLRANTVLGNIAAGGVTGAGYGYGHGFAEGEGGFDERLGTAADYAKLGGAFGAALPAATALASGAFNTVRTAAPQIAARLPGRAADNIADDIIATRIERSGMTPQQIEAELVAGQNAARFGANSQAHLPEMLADTSDTMQRLTGSVYRQGGRAGEQVRDALETRQRGDPNQMSRFGTGDTGQRGQIDDALSRALQLRTSASARATDRQIAAEQAREGRRLYEEAYRNSEDFDLGPAIVGLGLTRQQYTGPFRQVLDRASALFEAPSMGAITRGNRNFYGMDIRRFDAAKKQLDDMIESAQRSGENNLARELTTFKGNLLNQVHATDDAGNATRNLGYRDARNAWGSAAENREAIELGRAALREGSEVSLEQYHSLTPGQQVLFRQGFLEGVRNATGRLRPGNDATLPFQSARVQDLLREIIPNSHARNAVFADRSGNFGEYISRQQRIGSTNNRVLGNSATAQRLQDDAEFAADALSRVMVGLRGLTNAGIEVVGAILTRATAYRQDVAEALARRLVNADHGQQVQLLRTLQGRIGPQRFQTLMQELDRAIPTAPGALGGETPQAPAALPPPDRFEPPMRLGGPKEGDQDAEARRQMFIERFGVDPNQSAGDFALDTLKNFAGQAAPTVAGAALGPVLRGAGAVARAFPNATRTGLAALGITGASSGAGRTDEVSEVDRMMGQSASQLQKDQQMLEQLVGQRQSLDQQRAKAVEERDAQLKGKDGRKGGRGPVYKAKEEEVQRITNEMTTLDSSIADIRKRTSPEYQADVKKSIEAEQARQNILDTSRKPFEEQYPTLAKWWWLAPAGAGLLTASFLKGGLGGQISARLQNTRWWQAVNDAKNAATPTARAEARILAEKYEKAIPKETWKSTASTYGSAASIGALEGAGVANIPEFHDLFLPPKNPERRAYEEYIRRLPNNHPEIQRTIELLKSIPEDNPDRKAAIEHFGQIKPFIVKSVEGALEGAFGAMFGTTVGKAVGPKETARPRPETQALSTAHKARVKANSSGTRKRLSPPK